jgi:excisionase family DNA binding protein
MSESPYLTAAEVATELGISRHGVYKLIERGKLKAIRRSERNLRVSRLALDAYRRRLNAEEPAADVVESVDLTVAAAAFERETGMAPDEWERSWKSDCIEDTPENMRLTIRALSLRAAGASAERVDPVSAAALHRS